MAVMTPLKPAPMTAIRQPSRAIPLPPACVLDRRRSGRVGEPPSRAGPHENFQPRTQFQLPVARAGQLGLDRLAQALDLELDPDDRSERADMEHLRARAVHAGGARHDLYVLRPHISLAATEQLDRSTRTGVDAELLVPHARPAS